jgi:hypothetical protein
MLIPVFLITSLTCTQEQEQQTIDVLDLIPQDNEISGWVRDGNMEVAENETQLYALIDGEGDVFIDHGFVKCAFQSFQGQVVGNPRSIDLRIFDMGNASNAQEVYHDNRLETGSEVPWVEVGHAGTEARIEYLSGFHIIEFREDRFYVDIVINDDTQEALNIAQLFALNVSDAIGQ